MQTKSWKHDYCNYWLANTDNGIICKGHYILKAQIGFTYNTSVRQMIKRFIWSDGLWKFNEHLLRD